jgi:hypothetical protein
VISDLRIAISDWRLVNFEVIFYSTASFLFEEGLRETMPGGDNNGKPGLISRKERKARAKDRKATIVMHKRPSFRLGRSRWQK